MPWKAKKVGDSWCSVNTETGKKVSCFGMDKAKAEAHVKALYANTKEKLEDGENYGETVLAIALTNQPHLSLRNHPITVVEVDGQEMMRIPVIPAGKYRHSKGNLNLNTYPITDKRNRLNKIVANHYTAQRDSGVYVRPHHESRESWGWVDGEDGWMSIENENGKDVVVVYSKATNDERLDAIKRKEYRYASADLSIAYRSNQLSREEDVIHWDEVQLEETDMDELEKAKARIKDLEGEIAELKTKAKEGETAQAKVEEVESQVEGLQEEKKELEKTVARLEAKLAEHETPDPELPEAVRLEMEKRDRRIAELEKENRTNRRKAALRELALAIKRGGEPDAKGQILPAVFLEEIRKFAKGEKIEVASGEVLTLEADDKPETVYLHTISFLSHLIDAMPRNLQAEAETVGNNRRDLSDAWTRSEEEMAEFDRILDEAGLPKRKENE